MQQAFERFHRFATSDRDEHDLADLDLREDAIGRQKAALEAERVQLEAKATDLDAYERELVLRDVDLQQVETCLDEVAAQLDGHRTELEAYERELVLRDVDLQQVSTRFCFHGPPFLPVVVVSGYYEVGCVLGPRQGEMNIIF
ncbi:hypothetical protein ACFL6C_13725 [Myxococcota bacterium]